MWWHNKLPCSRRKLWYDLSAFICMIHCTKYFSIWPMFLLPACSPWMSFIVSKYWASIKCLRLLKINSFDNNIFLLYPPIFIKNYLYFLYQLNCDFIWLLNYIINFKRCFNCHIILYTGWKAFDPIELWERHHAWE